MNLVAKIRRLSDDIEELKAKLDALETRNVQMTLPVVELPINIAEPIVSATVAPLPRKRGRPPKQPPTS